MRTIAELADLQGRHALITGGAGHVGLAAAETLIEMGARVALLDVDRRACAARASALAPSSDSAIAVPCDLSDESAVRAAVTATVEALGGLDIVVHAAAFVGTTSVDGWAVPFESQSVAAWDAAMRVNLTAAFVLSQSAWPHLRESGRGSIIFVSSIYGLVGPDFRLYEGTQMANPAGYGASKGGLVQLMRYLATAMAPGVRVNAISPGGIWRSQPAEFVAQYESRTPLRRMAREEDLKGALAFLASDLSGYVTGHDLVVDGGWTAW